MKDSTKEAMVAFLGLALVFICWLAGILSVVFVIVKLLQAMGVL